MKKIDLTKGNVLKVILSLATPLVVTSLLQFAYNFVNMIWVGGLGSGAVASIGASSIYIGLGYSVNAMVVIGGSVKVAHALGKKDEEEVNKYINTSFILNFTLGIIFGSIILIYGKSLIGFLGINDLKVNKSALSYLLINGSTMVIVFFNTFYTRIFSSFGNNKISLKISGIGLILNIILDPIFIYTFKLGVNGAAIATVISNIVVFIMSVYFSKDFYTVNFKKYFDIIALKEIMRLGIPNSMQRIIFTLINIALAKIISKFGADAIAAQKIGLQIESITFTIIGGFNGAAASFVGQNFGAKRLDRINSGYKISLILGTIYTLFITIAFIAIPERLAAIFVRDIITIKITADYLRIIGISQILAAVEMITNGAFTGLGSTKYSAIISVSLTVIRVPLALVLIDYFEVNGVWWSIAISSMLKGIVAFSVYRFILWKKVVRRIKYS
ncbi:MATE family efflux transporter [Clostridium cylindrosporum]|nr:MATE family efflux transporter [Clostridium cylindrosporum]